MSSGGGDVVVGYKYSFGIHMGISRGPVNELVEIKVGDKVAWRGSISTNTNTTIDQPNLFGGEKGEGGIQGTLTTLFGGPTQTAPSELATVLETPMPGFRRAFTVFFDGIVSMMNPYPKPWKFRVRRATAGWDGDPWYPEKAVISIVRPVSTGETTGGTTETTTIAGTSSGVPVRVEDLSIPWGFKWEMPIDLPNETAAITRVYFKSGQGIDEVFFDLTETTDYEIGADKITFFLRFETESFTPWYYDERTVYFDYTYTVTTTNPVGGGAGSLGDVLIQAMNPVHILYEALTNREWGRGLPREMLDDPSWRYAADKCAIEKFGICIRWNRRDEVRSFIQLILDHVGGVLFDDRKTGKIRIALIRDDYVKDELPIFDSKSGLLEIREMTVSTQVRTVNEVRVTYRDPVTDEDRTVRANNLAALQSSGGVVNSISKQYPGIPTAEIAGKVAKRDLRSMSPAIRRFSITLDRRGYEVYPGGVFRIQDLARGIPDMVLRAGTIDYGKIGDGKIQVAALQDVFGLPQRGFTTMAPPTWTPPTTRPCVADSVAFEMPYRSMYRLLSPADFDYLPETGAHLGVVAQEGQPLNTTFNIAVRPGAVESEDNPPDNSYVCGV